MQLLDSREPVNARAKRFYALIKKKKKYNNCHGEAGTQKAAAISIYIATTVSTAQNNGIWERVLLSPEDRLIQYAGKNFKLRKRYSLNCNGLRKLGAKPQAQASALGGEKKKKKRCYNRSKQPQFRSHWSAGSVKGNFTPWFRACTFRKQKELHS